MATSMLTNNNNNNNDEVFSEIEERRHAELEIILSAYEGDDNIWIIPSLKSLDEKNNKEEKYPLASSSPEIHRRFTLENSTPNSNNNNDTKQIIELIVTMPQENQYPVLDTSVLHVDGKVIQQEDTKNDILELMLKKHLPHFIDACRQVANENHGMESIFMVLAKADEWIEHEWTTIQQQEQQQEENETNLKKKLSLSFSKINDTTNTSAATTTTTTKTKPPPQPSRYQSQSQPQQFYLHVIRSHHLLNHAPDNLLAKGGTKYKLNGFYRFGTPGLAFCITTNNNNNDNDHVNVENFKRAMETKMSQKKFEIILARPMSTMTTRTNNELYHGWNEATIEQLQSILTHDEFRDILNIQGGGGGGSSSSNRTANTTTTTTGNTKNKGTKKNGKNKGNKKK